jgi:hypothetical protein
MQQISAATTLADSRDQVIRAVDPHAPVSALMTGHVPDMQHLSCGQSPWSGSTIALAVVLLTLLPLAALRSSNCLL